MPYKSTSASKSISVYTVNLTCSANKRWVTLGGAVTFSGKLTYNGNPYTGRTVEIQELVPAGWVRRATGGTDSTGKYSATIKFTNYDYGCRDVSFRAYFEGVASGTVKVAVAFPTRISVSAPSRVKPGVPFTVSGKLEYESSSGVWSGLANRTVSIRIGSTTKTATTGSNGSYSASFTLSSSGSYTITASYAGENIPTIVSTRVPLAAPTMAVAI